MRPAVALVLVAVLGAAGAPAPPAPAQPAPAPAPPQPPTPDAGTKASDALYREAVARYAAGDYEGAIELLEQAYAISGSPELLFNIAQAHRRAGRCEAALRYYDEALARDPDPPNRTEILERIAEMQRCERARREASTARSPVAPATPTPEARRSRVPLAVALSGTGLAALGGGLYLAAQIRFQQAQGTCPCRPGSFSGWERTSDAAYLFGGVGGAIGLAGLLWYALAPAGEAPATTIVPTADGAGVAWTF